MANTIDDCAELILDTVPLLMSIIRGEMRRSFPGLSIPQFRALAFLRHFPGGSLSHLANHLGLTLPATSKLVDGLVNHDLVARHNCAADRRKVELALTLEGETILDRSQEELQKYLANLLEQLTESELVTICHAFQIMHPLFASNTPEVV